MRRVVSSILLNTSSTVNSGVASYAAVPSATALTPLALPVALAPVLVPALPLVLAALRFLADATAAAASSSTALPRPERLAPLLLSLLPPVSSSNLVNSINSLTSLRMDFGVILCSLL